MPVTRNPDEFNGLVEWTDSVLEVPLQSGFINSRNYFSNSYTEQNAVLFDKIESSATLLPTVNRKGGAPSYGKDRDVKTFSLGLAYFHHMDSVTKQDFITRRRAGTADTQDDLANVISEKLVDMKRQVDQTHEYMKLQAIKGITKAPDGKVIADMFTEFGVAQPTIDFDLGTGSTNVKAKIAQLKSTVVKNLKTGGIIMPPLDVIVDREFFDKFVNHATIKEAYLNSQSNAQYQKDLSEYFTWGITDVWAHDGIRLMVYDHTFNLPDGSSEVAIAANTGHVIPTVRGDSIFRSVYGRSERLDSTGGAEMFAWSWRAPNQRSHELEIETSPLMFCTKPTALVKVTTST